MRDRLLKPAIDHRRLGQLLPGFMGQLYPGVDENMEPFINEQIKYRIFTADIHGARI
jgi:hypothetical protein